MGDEVEAAIFNDGKKASEKLKPYINQQMVRVLSNKMNMEGHPLKNTDFV